MLTLLITLTKHNINNIKTLETNQSNQLSQYVNFPIWSGYS